MLHYKGQQHVLSTIIIISAIIQLLLYIIYLFNYEWADIIKKYNPDLKGFSVGKGNQDSPNAKFDVAVSAAVARSVCARLIIMWFVKYIANLNSGMLAQAEDLVEKMRNDDVCKLAVTIIVTTFTIIIYNYYDCFLGGRFWEWLEGCNVMDRRKQSLFLLSTCERLIIITINNYYYVTELNHADF